MRGSSKDYAIASCLMRIGDSITRAPWLKVMVLPGQRSQAAR